MVTQWKAYWCEKTPSRIICKYIISMTTFTRAIWLYLTMCLKYHSRQFHAPTPPLYAFSTQAVPTDVSISTGAGLRYMFELLIV